MLDPHPPLPADGLIDDPHHRHAPVQECYEGAKGGLPCTPMHMVRAMWQIGSAMNGRECGAMAFRLVCGC